MGPGTAGVGTGVLMAMEVGVKALSRAAAEWGVRTEAVRGGGAGWAVRTVKFSGSGLAEG